MPPDPLVIFIPSGKRGTVPTGTTVLEAARMLGVDLDSVCGGRGICSRCQFQTTYGDFPKYGISVASSALSSWNIVEKRYKLKRGLKEGRRLGCQAKIQCDIVIDVPPESQVHRQIVRKNASTRTIRMNPATKLFYVEVEEPDMHSPSGDFERIKRAFLNQWKITSISVDPSLLPKLQAVLRKGNWKVTGAIWQDHNATTGRLIELWPGLQDQPLFGLAIDLGSTTIAAHLTNLSSGEVVASSGLMNPQIRFGEDLMSRVSYAMMNANGHQEMTHTVRDALRRLIQQLADESNVDSSCVIEAVIVCNPVMHHLLLGVDPTQLGQAPFALATSESLTLRASDLGLDSMNSRGQIYILPCIAGHVGADAAAVALSERPDISEDLVLIVDIGTNAEILLGNKHRVLACSSPTGPAFEGAQISSGQRAASGAIEKIEISTETKEPRFRVIGSDLWSDEEGFMESLGSTGITGICGSGIIEAIAEMRIAGLIDRSGLIGSATQSNTDRCVPDGRTHSYVIYDVHTETETGVRIAVTQADVRAIQLAKSALYAGARLLMDEFDVDTVDRIILAGAFGAHISAKHALVLGMIPDAAIANVFSAGNAAGTGSQIALCDISMRSEVEQLVRNIHKIETAIEPRFQEHFIAANAIPHQTDVFPKLAQIVTLPDISFNAHKAQSTGSGRRRRKRLQ